MSIADDHSKTNKNPSSLVTRRSAIVKGVAVAFTAATLRANKANAALCQDPEELSSTDYSFRKYVEYTESWKNPDQSCRHCAAFKPGPEENACGRCQAIAGSINPNGHCTGWEQKKAAK